MSKNLTRKGLALTSVVALGLAGLNASPALAANAQNGLSLKTFVGKTYSVPLGTTFTLSAFGTAFDDNADNLKFEVTNTSGSEVCWYDDGSDCSSDTSFVIADEDWDGSNSNVDNRAYDYDGDAGYQLNLWVNDASATTSVKVTAFIDSEPEGTSGFDEFDAAEDTANASQTVTFAKTTAKVSVDQPLDGDSTITGSYTLSPAANLAQLDYDSYDDMGFIEVFAGSSNTDDVYTYWDEDSNSLLWSASESVNDGTSYKADAYLYTWDSTNENYDWEDVKSSTDRKAVVTDKVDDLGDFVVADSADVYTDIDGDPTDGGDSYATLRSGVKTVTASIQAWADYDTKKSPAGQPVRIYVSDDGLNTGSSVTVGGKTLKAGDSDVHFDTTTDANGQVKVTVTGSAKDGDDLQIWAVSQGETSDDLWISWEDAYADNLVDATPYDSSDETQYKAIKNGASTSINYAVYDQFGKLYTSSHKLRLVTDLTDADFASGYDYVYTALSGGKATVSITDDSSSEDDYYAYTWLEAYVDGSWTYDASEDSTSDVYSYFYTNDKLLTPAAIDDVEIDGDTEEYVADEELTYSLSTDDFGTADTRTGADEIDINDYVYVEGYINDADLLPVAGQKVTATAAGAQFVDDNWDIFTVGSNTQYTNLDGWFGFYVASHVAGPVKVNVTAGGVTHVVTVTFEKTSYADALANDDAHLKVVVSPKNAAAGSATNVAISLVDGYGNGLDCDGNNPDVDLEAIGAGYLSSETVTLTDSCKANVKLITGVADKGLTVINATISDDDLDATADALVGVTAATKGGDNVTTATVKNAKGLSVQLFIDGVLKKTVIPTSNNFSFTQAIKKLGKHQVKVTVNGVTVANGVRTIF
jgi:hypothetical protein